MNVWFVRFPKIPFPWMDQRRRTDTCQSRHHSRFPPLGLIIIDACMTLHDDRNQPTRGSCVVRLHRVSYRIVINASML